MAIPVSKNQEITLEISGLGSDGQGIGRVEGYALFVAATIIVVKCFFKNFELGPERGEEPDAAESAPAAAELKQAVETAQAVTDAAQPFEKGGEQND